MKKINNNSNTILCSSLALFLSHDGNSRKYGKLKTLIQEGSGRSKWPMDPNVHQTFCAYTIEFVPSRGFLKVKSRFWSANPIPKQSTSRWDFSDRGRKGKAYYFHASSTIISLQIVPIIFFLFIDPAFQVIFVFCLNGPLMMLSARVANP